MVKFGPQLLWQYSKAVHGFSKYAGEQTGPWASCLFRLVAVCCLAFYICFPIRYLIDVFSEDPSSTVVTLFWKRDMGFLPLVCGSSTVCRALFALRIWVISRL